ncbi:hypothetical protein [Clostridium tagluense]|uniref:Uncharacterized protein n=1 Tax=Clostridium tagluense TaxID=360422 RepID=A0A401UHE7_9CLOT|nr:hypothetical protein [Clostridium tagluense]GCD08983.1 hypothetical protein Ctaglu_06060 [Clostridium tagluense]
MDKEILDILKSMQGDMKSIKITQEEHTQILRGLEHKTDVLSAQQENLKNEVKGMRKEMSSVEIIKMP